jgi:hypothetical protein
MVINYELFHREDEDGDIPFIDRLVGLETLIDVC